MRIERIDDKTVKCFLSNEELEEYEISYKDFILRSDKAREVVAEIIEQATEEVGYQPPRFAFDLQIMMLPEQGMILTFSEKEPEELSSGRDLMECLREVRNILERKNRNEENKDAAADMEQAEGKQQQKDRKPKNQKQEEQIPSFAVFCFQNLRAVSEYAQTLPGNLRIRSVLYVMNGKYYLYLDKGAASYERYSRACIQAMEFGTLYAAEHAKITYLEEHGECLIADHAVKKLKL